MFFVASESQWLTNNTINSGWDYQGHTSLDTTPRVLTIDNFQRANEGPEPTGWALTSGSTTGLVVLNRQLFKASSAGFARYNAYWNQAFTGNSARQIWFKIGTIPANSSQNAGMVTHIFQANPSTTSITAAAGKGWSCEIFSSNAGNTTMSINVYPINSGSGAWSYTTYTPTVGDTIVFRFDGSYIEVGYYSALGIYTRFFKHASTDSPDGGGSFGTAFDATSNSANWYYVQDIYGNAQDLGISAVGAGNINPDGLQATSFDSVGARVTGYTATNTSTTQNVRVTGEANSNAVYGARIYGITFTYTYQWQRADDSGFTANVTDIIGATSSTYVVQSADVGKYLRSKVVATAVPTGDVSAPAYSNVVGPVTQTTSNVSLNVRVTGESPSNVSLNVRVTGEASSNTSFAARATGEASSNVSYATRVTGEASSNTSYNVRVTGEASSNISQNVRVTGENTSNVSYAVRVTGENQSNTTQAVRVTGEASSFLSTDARIFGHLLADSGGLATRVTGEASSNVPLATRVTSEAQSNTSYNVRVTSESSSIVSFATRVTGESPSLVSYAVRVTGEAPSNVSLATRVTAEAQSIVSYAARLTGEASSNVSYAARVQGEFGSNVSQDARVTGEAQSNLSQNVKLTAAVPTDAPFSTDTRITGFTSSLVSQDVRVTGEAPSAMSQDVRMQGEATSAGSADVRTSAELGSNLSTDVRISASLASESSQDTRISGNLGSSVSQDVRVSPSTASNVSQDVRITGISTGTLPMSIGVFIAGTKLPNQALPPISDVATGNWHPFPATPITLYDKIDEATPDASDYIESGLSPATPDITEVLLQPAQNPFQTSGHVVSYVIAKDYDSGDRIDLTVRLMQGSTEIASWVHTDITAEPVETRADQLLTDAQAAMITDYTDLRLRFEAVAV